MLTQHGAKIGFYQGDIRKLTDDLQTLKPTIFVTVPRLLNRMYDKVGGYDEMWRYTAPVTYLVLSLCKDLQINIKLPFSVSLNVSRFIMILHFVIAVC